MTETTNKELEAAAKAEAKAIKEAEKKAAKEALAAKKAEEKAAKIAATAEAKAAKIAEKTAAKEAKIAEKAAKKQAAEQAKLAKIEAKAAAKAARESNRMPVQNGIRRPRPEGKCGRAWALMDAMSKELGCPVAIADLLVRSSTEGMNPNMVRSNYAVWRKFYNITGRIVPVAKQQAVQAAA